MRHASHSKPTDDIHFPRLQDTIIWLDTFQATIFTKLDLQGAYNLIRIREVDEWKKAFNTRDGHYEYLVMPFGICNTTAVFKNFNNEILNTSLNEHRAPVRVVLQRLWDHSLYANLEKCQFEQKKISFLGYFISSHEFVMDRAKDQKFTGMFAMTERGHGSNVRGILTEAVFDPVSQEFIINTPCENAEKMYIGNAMKGNYAAVFAQLITNGKSQGPHCFIVPIRDLNGKMYPGVGAVDMMHKEGLHGVDNGILTFNQVRIPRENLLDKFGSVSPDGKYHSSIDNKSARFNAMLAALTPTRLALTFQALGAMKLGLTIAIRYSHSRKWFDCEGE
ncbi:acyl-coenzyme A oxidase-like protein [Ascaphus truei]|uniref:acyl-coenzyme A oxidase-like protein n=1 Tax=Ascaphus truei TaxID=8439 RepID=UPI003F59A2DF